MLLREALEKVNCSGIKPCAKRFSVDSRKTLSRFLAENHFVENHQFRSDFRHFGVKKKKRGLKTPIQNLKSGSENPFQILKSSAENP